jgi:signal transduction histidine kinase
VRVEVQDTGPGIAADVLARIWEPSFTTKTGGLGLGLQISRTIVEGHGGSMACTSRPGQGTTIAFSLPQRLRVTAAVGEC